MQNTNYEKYMHRCFSLAKKGAGRVSPNPLVGCVVLNRNGDVISEGYHKKYGENHAERDALLKLSKDEALGGTLFVNLEPCNHNGKTPPCTDIIIDKGIKKVVISCRDTNPKAKGGIEKLRNAGIEVVENILENEGRTLNEIFFTNIEQNRPFIALKCATTIDGKISTGKGDSKWITSEKARRYAKSLRKKYDCILTSSATVIADNPEMKHKIKVIIDRNLKTDFNSKIYKQGKCFVFTTKTNASVPSNVELLEYIDLKTCVEVLYQKGIKSIFVEAGGTLSGSFVKEGLYDKLYHFIAPKILNDNTGRSAFDGDKIDKIADTKNLCFVGVKKLAPDILIEYGV